MAEVTINYKDTAIATMDASGTKTLQTQGKYCEDDIEVVYDRPSAPSGTKQIFITQNGTTTEDVAAYANAEITVNVQGGGSGPTFSAVTATASATNVRDAALMLVTNPAEDKVYFAITTKPKSTWVQNQFLAMLMDSNVAGCAFRWRDGAYNSTGSLGPLYDAVIQPGDTFLVCEADFVL